jgi:hypothetical protein
MPNMADITIKKADGTTDIVYKALNPSGGDKIAAKWRVDAIGTIAANRPILEIASKSSINSQFRIVEGKLTYPETFTDSTTGIIAVRTRELFSFTFTQDTTSADATILEAAKQSGNLMASTLVQAVFASGFAPQ